MIVIFILKNVQLNYDDYLKKAQERVAVNKEAEVNAANSAYNATKENTQNDGNDRML